VGPQGSAGQGDRGRGSPESQVDGEREVEVVAQRHSEAAVESEGQGGHR
jgi:hypothetical protein